MTECTVFFRMFGLICSSINRVERVYNYNAIGEVNGLGNSEIRNTTIPNSDISEIKESTTNSDFSTGSSSNLESMKLRRENILSELVETESKYVIDLKEVLVNYRDKLAVSNLTETRQRANTIFGNLGNVIYVCYKIFNLEIK